jgi:hypothetical protein
VSTQCGRLRCGVSDAVSVPWQPRLADAVADAAVLAPAPLADALAAVPPLITDVAAWGGEGGGREGAGNT